MDSSSVDKLRAWELVRLLRVDEGEGGGKWMAWAEAVERQLAAPLLPDLAQVRGAEGERLKMLVERRVGAETFLRQLTFISPSVELLEAIKRFAREQLEDGNSPLQGSGGTLLYYAAIAAALGRCKTRITQLGDQQLTEGFRWGLAQPVETLHAVFAAGLEAVEGVR